MAAQIRHFDPNARAGEKQAARAADERALRSGGHAAAQAKQRNEAFASVAADARPNLSAARSLS